MICYNLNQCCDEDRCYCYDSRSKLIKPCKQCGSNNHQKEDGFIKCKDCGFTNSTYVWQRDEKQNIK